jgi:hypothetical protein
MNPAVGVLVDRTVSIVDQYSTDPTAAAANKERSRQSACRQPNTPNLSFGSMGITALTWEFPEFVEN